MAGGLEKLEDLVGNFTALLQAAHIPTDDAAEARPFEKVELHAHVWRRVVRLFPLQT